MISYGPRSGLHLRRQVTFLDIPSLFPHSSFGPLTLALHRHGNRLDAANKQWHLQSPTPYDPPLTYSGWNQARATGQKIAQILREREAADAGLAATQDGPAKKRRRFKIVVHSSPFLRCVQTSIGISAGLASIPESTPTAALPARTSSTHSTTNPRSRPNINIDIPGPDVNSPSPQLFPDLPTPPELDSRPGSPKKSAIQKTVLRLDAFLGEWLTPGYFELITPPPGSGLMLASAKANLLRKEDYSNNPNFASYSLANNTGPAPRWGQSPTPATPDENVSNVSSLAEALRRAGRSDSVTSVTSNGESRLLTGGAYIAPSPAYAISHNAEIPNGYVPHARDNCCDIDYQWDSMRGKLDWGDGGELGEEWTSMHQRFRKGLQKLVDWYATAENPADMVTKERRKEGITNETTAEDDEDVEVEPVVIIVSHGAGCNALIGAITHKPVLTDVGLASLTEADRKSDTIEVNERSSRVTEASSTVAHPSGLVAIHENYDMKLFASTEHLSSTRTTRSPSTTATVNPASRGRLSNAFASSPLSGNGGLFSLDGSASRSASATANLNSARRDSGSSSQPSGRIALNMNGISGGGITVGSGVTSFLRQSSTTAGGGGLWSPLRNNLEAPDDDDDNFLPNFSGFDPPASTSTSTPKAEESAKPADRPLTPEKARNDLINRDRSESMVSPRSVISGPNHHDEERESISALPQLGSGHGGLWGSPRPLADDISRDLSSPKRRWTVTERW